MSTNTALADFIWKNADDLWGNFKHVDFGKIILLSDVSTCGTNLRV